MRQGLKGDGDGTQEMAKKQWFHQWFHQWFLVVPELSSALVQPPAMSQGPHHQSPTLSDEVVVLTCCEQHILGLNMDLPGPCNMNGL